MEYALEGTRLLRVVARGWITMEDGGGWWGMVEDGARKADHKELAVLASTG